MVVVVMGGDGGDADDDGDAGVFGDDCGADRDVDGNSHYGVIWCYI